MAYSAKVVAVLVSTPALSSILSVVLASVPTLRVRPFDSQIALTTYMRLAPVDLIVSDFDSENAPADRLARDLHRDATLEQPDFQMIALASSVTAETKVASIHAGIDEIIVKPMSPKYLLERVLARLEQQAPRPARPTPPRLRPGHAAGNVVPLFRSRFETLH